MQNPQTIKEAFLPLNGRLLDYEDGEFLINMHEYNEQIAVDKIRSVYLNASLFGDSEKYGEALKYKNRILRIQPTIEPLINAQSFSEELTRSRVMTCYNELANYFFYLTLIEEDTLDFIEKPTNGTVIEYQLEPNFKLKKLKSESGFESRMSAAEAALFLYYLTEKRISPLYSAISRGLLGKALFWIDNTSIKDTYKANIPPLNNLDLMALKGKLNEIIERIDKDLLIKK